LRSVSRIIAGECRPWLLRTHIIKRPALTRAHPRVDSVRLKRIHPAKERIDYQPARHAEENNISEGVPVAKTVFQRHARRIIAFFFQRQRVGHFAKIAAVRFLQGDGLRRDARYGDLAGAVSNHKRHVRRRAVDINRFFIIAHDGGAARQQKRQ